MLDYLRNLRKSDEEKQREALNAYLDDALSVQQQRKIEGEIATNSDLKMELDQMRLIQQQMRQLPQRQVPRNFTLDPALFGRPRREPLIQAYPVLRTATVLTAFIFIFALAANLFLGGVSNLAPGSAETAAIIAEQAVEIAAEEEAEPAEEAAEGEMAFEMEVQPQMTAEALPEEEAALLPPDLEEAADEMIAGEQEMPAAAMEAPDFDTMPAEPESLATLAADDLDRQTAPIIEGTIEVEGQLMLPAATPTASAVEIAEQPVPLEAPKAAPEDAATGQTSQVEIAEPATLWTLSSLSLILLLLGVIFIILLVLTIVARRRIRE